MITNHCLKYISNFSRVSFLRIASKASTRFCVRRMSLDHLQRTASNTRHNVVSGATVVKVKDESSTVKKLTLKVHDKRFFFKAGQWVDMMIPKVEKVGGFSMCSSPRKLAQDGLLDLAVKKSNHPPAHWVHTQCREGIEVNIRSGGDTFYDPKPDDPQPDLLLLAGGIGINPLYSILCHVTDLLPKKEENFVILDKNTAGADNFDHAPNKVCLLYSASVEDELIFQRELSEAVEQYPCVDCQYFLTRETTQKTSLPVKNRRINHQDIQDSFRRLRKEKTMVYICGPSPMIETMETILLGAGIGQQQILFEKWW
ncbi:oxidoreductase NAD-binding domain-containing protein 1-like [Ylistrum balloti]|uniref:oxidoreductase NAD-binding domain-containing protein 1-like n=1 Tax=Ylistrum balloti TaxID=509963 RepID=UPI002905A16B|nr:oxidoreductase NAD-binding domain-containing protein 1-like [Ylistrum balloti]